MYPVYLRVADGPMPDPGIPGGRPELIKVDAEPGDAAFKKLMRNKVIVRAEVDALGRNIFTVRAKGIQTVRVRD